MSSKYKFSNDDDVEDAYTEKGRQLIAREREAVGKGFAVGQVREIAWAGGKRPGGQAGGRRAGGPARGHAEMRGRWRTRRSGASVEDEA